MEELTFQSAETHDRGGGANKNFAPQEDADLQIIGGATLTKLHLGYIGGAKCLSLCITIHLTFLLGELMGELIFGIGGGAIAPPSSPLEPPMIAYTILCMIMNGRD